MRDLGPVSILVSDDSSTIRKFIQRALATIGRRFDITEVDDGGKACEQLEKKSFDIAFLDLQMPIATGVEVMGAIQKMSSKTFAVAMSDELTSQNETLLKSFGAYNFLKKPFSEDAIRDVIKCYDAIKSPHDVLIVDDSATVRKVVHKVLSRSIFNLNLLEAADGPSALAATEQQKFRIIFSDFNMPDMTGIELAENLAVSAVGSDVIIMSTEITDTIDTAARKVGARAFLKKPFYPQDVDTIPHHLFGLPHSHFGKSVRMFATV